MNQPSRAIDYGRTFQIVGSKDSHDVWGMRSGERGVYNMKNRAPGERGWLGNPDRANDAGGMLTRKEATEAFFSDFVERYQSDAGFRAAAQGLVGKRVAYYKPDEQWVHLKPVQEWLATRDFAADNGGSRRINPQGFIETLGPGDVFVFGSNLAGRHGKGAALTAAKQFGAEYGVGEGLTGQSYALPTKDERLQVVSPQRLVDGLTRLAETARQSPKRNFLLTRVGQGLAGMDEAEVRRAIEGVGLPENVLPWWSWEKGQAPDAPPPPPPKEPLEQLELDIEQAPRGEIRWAGQVLPILAAAASLGLGGAALAQLVAERDAPHPEVVQG